MHTGTYTATVNDIIEVINQKSLINRSHYLVFSHREKNSLSGFACTCQVDHVVLPLRGTFS